MFAPTDKIAILGQSGCGKTTLCQAIQKHFPRRLVIDRMREYARGAGKNEWHVSDWAGYTDALKKSVGLSQFQLVFQFGLEADNHDMLFDHVLRTAYLRGQLGIVIEEVWNFATSHHMPKWLKETLLTGRHQGLGLIATSQRPAEVHKTLLSQCQHVYCGTVHEGNDVNYLSSILGKDALKLSNLKRGEFMHFSPGNAPKIISNKSKFC